MKKLVIFIAASGILVTGVAVAHPLLGPYETMGACERDFVDFNKAERLRDFDDDTSIGDTQGEIHKKFECQYHEGDVAPYDDGPGWYFTNIQGPVAGCEGWQPGGTPVARRWAVDGVLII